MNIEQEIRAQIEKNKGLKLAVGEINNHLSILEGLLRNERDDVQKQVNDAYQRGLEEGKKATWGLVADASSAEYQRGLEDGKEAINKGCEGCRYSGTPQGDSPCFSCSNYYQNNWQKQDDNIEVGDEVDWSGDKFIVTRIFQPYDKAEECDGVDMDGCTYHDVIMSGLTKTGRHVDITDMLKGALE